MQLTVDHVGYDASVQMDERAARQALRLQVARLERELAQLVADGFPHVAPMAGVPRGAGGRAGARSHVEHPRAGVGAGAPSLLDLGQLERARDELAGELKRARRRRTERAEFERRSRDLLERMRLQPGRYKFVRLPVRDLGEGSCGVWEVRPRLGLLGMLAGWWQVKLSSGCPLG